MPETDWVRQGDCREMGERGLVIFYSDHVGVQQIAKAICSHCPVQIACREWALANEQFGVWGGTTARERVRLRRVFRPERSLQTVRRGA